MSKKYYKLSEIEFQPHPNTCNFIDKTGKTYARLTVLGFAGNHASRTAWYCQCECGNVVKVIGNNLKRVKSCGCATQEQHGMRYTPEYEAYRGSKGRCQNRRNKGFKYYGARGIKFKFRSFSEFFAHIGKRPSDKHSLDRVDNNGHYEIGNVRWATRKQQNNNTRQNRPITINGETKNLAQWAEKSPLNYRVIHDRIKLGWCPHCALAIPLNGGSCPHR